MKASRLLFLITVIMLAGACRKNNLSESLTGTIWWHEESLSSGGTSHAEFTFTSFAFYAEITYPHTPSYPPTRTTGSYTYEYPLIHLDCPDFKDNAIMAPDRQSFKIGSQVFVRK